jgi:hypothetical protein
MGLNAVSVESVEQDSLDNARQVERRTAVQVGNAAVLFQDARMQIDARGCDQ